MAKLCLYPSDSNRQIQQQPTIWRWVVKQWGLGCWTSCLLISPLCRNAGLLLGKSPPGLSHSLPPSRCSASTGSCSLPGGRFALGSWEIPRLSAQCWPLDSLVSAPQADKAAPGKRACCLQIGLGLADAPSADLPPLGHPDLLKLVAVAAAALCGITSPSASKFDRDADAP